MTAKGRRSSVRDTTDALENMSAGVAEWVLATIEDGPGDCITSIFHRAGRAPQIMWTGTDGVDYQMYHWRVYMYLTEGRIPALYSTRRKCANPRCVNPDHRR